MIKIGQRIKHQNIDDAVIIEKTRFLGIQKMSNLLEAIYEGNGLIRLKTPPKGIQPDAIVQVMVLTVPHDDAFVTEEKSLQDQLREFETQYQMGSVSFYEQYHAGQLGDKPDYVSWAAVYQMHLQQNNKP